MNKWHVVKDGNMARIEYGEVNHGNIVCGWCAPIAWALLDEVVAAHNVEAEQLTHSDDKDYFPFTPKNWPT